MPELQPRAHGPALAEPAPDFEAAIGGGTISLGDYRGNWIILLSHAEEHLPLFRTRTMNYLLCKRRTRVLVLGDERLAERYASGSFLKKYVLKHRLTVIDDADQRIASSYGLGNGAGTDSKGLFVIDGKGVLRAKLYYPLTAERDLYEALKLIDTLQQASRSPLSKPDTAAWRKRLKVAIRPRPVEQS